MRIRKLFAIVAIAAAPNANAWLDVIGMDENGAYGKCYILGTGQYMGVMSNSECIEENARSTEEDMAAREKERHEQMERKGQAQKK